MPNDHLQATTRKSGLRLTVITPPAGFRPACWSLDRATWWDVGSDGNRLAIQLCLFACHEVCRIQCAAQVDAGAVGTIRAGIPYDDANQPMRVCHCGYPTQGKALCCPRCAVPNIALMSRRDYHREYARRHRRAAKQTGPIEETPAVAELDPAAQVERDRARWRESKRRRRAAARQTASEAA